ncbi:MAG: aminodeoxychorismate synthase component I [Brevinematia bacterium]
MTKKNHFVLFDKPIYEITAKTEEEIDNKLKEIDSILEEKLYIAGFITYEAGEKLNNIKPKPLQIPYLWFGVFTKPKIVEIPDTKNDYKISNISFSLSLEEYFKKLTQIKQYLKDGYTYQVNFTFKAFFEFIGNPFELYLSIRRNQNVKYSSFTSLGNTYILSLSPELFFEKKNNIITTKPMKGTINRGRFLEEDIKLKKYLYLSEKNRAENLMIVDLLRNDLGSISEFGSVKVKKLFEIEKYQTLFQMTSTILSKLKNEIKFYDIFKKIFPSGSVTGAPKPKTMEIINNLEDLPRNIYTGSIGYITPDKNAQFNVAIRTPIIIENRGEMGIGSGITWYSEEEKEYKECLLKANFLILPTSKKFKLIETMLLKNNKILLEKYHIRRLIKSAKYFGFKLNKNLTVKKLNELKQLNTPQKIRLLLNEDGRIEIELDKINKQKEGFIKIAQDKVNSKNVFLYHKTTNRELYDYYYKKAQEENIIDYIFLNEKNEITEGCIHNIIIIRNRNLLTPKRESGLLLGTMLSYLKRKYKIKYSTITLEDLEQAEMIYLCNSVSGIKRVKIKK